MKSHMTDDMFKVIMKDILYRRNQKVIEALQKALASGAYNTIVIPWGALHMAEIEEAVRNNGFNLRGSTERLSVDFRKIDLSRLMRRLADER
jgi:hypothetical protein